MWLLIVNMLATLDISKATDENGDTIEPDVQFNDSVFRCAAAVTIFVFTAQVFPLYSTPSPFKCTILPRSEQAARLIQQI